MAFGIILLLLIAGLSYVVARLFRINERNEMEQAKRQFEIAQKERAVEIVREVREKRQRIEASAVKRAGSLTTQLRRDFPTTAPLATRLEHRGKALKALRERKEAARARAARMGAAPVDLYAEPAGGLSYDYGEDEPKAGHSFPAEPMHTDVSARAERAPHEKGADEPRLPWEK